MQLALAALLLVPRYVTLPHPHTGRSDHRARIVDTFVDRNSRLPVSIVRFRDGTERPVATHRLRPIRVQRKTMATLDRRARHAITHTFGVAVLARTISQPEHRFLAGLRARGVTDASIDNYAAYRDGKRVYVNRDLAAFVPSNRVHEYLHVAASPAWTTEVRARGFFRLDEGITEWLTGRACRKTRLPFSPVDDYQAPYAAARALEALVGRRALEDAYFRGGLSALEAAVNTRLGRGKLAQVATDLEFSPTRVLE